MSHFTECEVNVDQKYEADFVAALEEVFGKGSVEVHGEDHTAHGASLKGYTGDDRARLPEKSPNYAPPCHIIVRRKHVGSASNDVGYRRTADGKYVGYISEFDQGHNFSKRRQDMVAQDYATRVAEKNLKKQGWTVRRVTLDDGTIRLKASSYSK